MNVNRKYIANGRCLQHFCLYKHYLSHIAILLLVISVLISVCNVVIRNITIYRNKINYNLTICPIMMCKLFYYQKLNELKICVAYTLFR
jgi:hypothetical protein